MQSDIHLDGNWLVLEGNWTRVRSLDLMLDAPSRRQNPQGHRRALVHDHQDGLTINYAEDYPGGVTIQGKVHLGEARINGNLEAGAEVRIRGRRLARVTETDPEQLVLGESNTTNTIEVEGPGMQINSGLQVRGDAYFDRPIHTSDLVLDWPPTGGPQPAPQAFRQVIADLQTKIAQLEARVAELEHN